MAFSSAFQPNAFQVDAFQATNLNITSTVVIELPVDFFLAQNIPFKEMGQTFEGGVFRKTKAVVSKSSGVARLSGKPGFTVTTNRL